MNESNAVEVGSMYLVANVVDERIERCRGRFDVLVVGGVSVVAGRPRYSFNYLLGGEWGWQLGH